MPSAKPAKKTFTRSPRRPAALRGGGAWALANGQSLPEYDASDEAAAAVRARPERFRLEPLWSGHRVLLARRGDSVRLTSEDGRDWAFALPRIKSSLLAMKRDPFLAEGVLTALDACGRPSFERLRALVDENSERGILIVLTDLLIDGDRDLRALPLGERCRALDACAVPEEGPFVRTQSLEGPIDALLSAVEKLGFRGLAARPLASAYPPAEADTWIALAAAETQRHLSPRPKVTNATKVLYPRDGITKTEIVAYYAAIAPTLLPYASRRPVVAQRWPDGIDDFTWYQHRVPPRAPDYIGAVMVDDVRRILVENADALAWFANQAALTLHGFASRVGSLDSPDWMILDLDPGESTSWAQTIEVALALRRALELLEVSSVVKTSGKKGLHVLVPLAPGQRGASVQEAARAIGHVLHRLLPATTTLETEREKRRGRLLIDTTQGFRGKILVMPYSLRDADGATVSAPLAWTEVDERLDPRAFNLRTMAARIERAGDLAAPLLRGTASVERILAKLR